MMPNGSPRRLDCARRSRPRVWHLALGIAAAAALAFAYFGTADDDESEPEFTARLDEREPAAPADRNRHPLHGAEQANFPAGAFRAAARAGIPSGVRGETERLPGPMDRDSGDPLSAGQSLPAARVRQSVDPAVLASKELGRAASSPQGGADGGEHFTGAQDQR